MNRASELATKIFGLTNIRLKLSNERSFQSYVVHVVQPLAYILSTALLNAIQNGLLLSTFVIGSLIPQAR